MTVDLSQFAGACPLGVIVTDGDGTIQAFNAAAERIFGYPAHEVLKHDVSILFGMRSGALDLYQRLRGESLLPCEVRAVRADGVSIMVELSVSELSTGDRPIFVAMIRDATDRTLSSPVSDSDRDLRLKIAHMEEANRLAELGSFEVTLDTRQVTWSDVTFHLYDRDPALGQPHYDDVMSYYHPEDKEWVKQSRDQALADGEPFICDMRVRQRDGSYRYMRIARHVESDPSGKPIRFYGTVQDIHDRKMAEIALRESEARLAEAQQIANMGSFEFRFDTGEVVWSAETFRLLCRDPSLGPPAYEEILTFYHPDDVAAAVASREQAIVGGGASFATDTRVRQRDGSYRYCRIVRNLIRKPDGTPDRLNGIVLDIHDRKMAEIAAEENAARLDEAQQIACMGSYEFRFDTKENIWSDQVYRLFDRDVSLGPPTYDEVASYYHPDDLAAILQSRERAINGDAASFVSDTRVRQGDGSYRYYRIVRNLTRTPDGRPECFKGIVIDIHERKMAELALKESEARLAEAQATAHLGSYEFNCATGELLWSDETYRLFDREPQDHKPSYEEVMAAYHPEDLVKLLELRKQSLEAGEQYELDLRVKQKDGTYRWCHSITRPIRDANGKPLRIIGTLIDIHDRKSAEDNLRLANTQLAQQKADLESANDRLQALATTDALTGLANHRAFQERLASEWNRSNRYLNPFSVILLDIDRFKMYNDSYGHPQGDRVLRSVAEVLKSAARDSDLVARYGGEEFVILLPETSREQACLAAERFRLAIEQHTWPLRRITASFGVATVNMALDAAQSLVDAADRAMYAAKRGGSNCLRHADAMSSLLDADAPVDQKLAVPPLPIMPEALLAVGSDLESLLLKAYDGTISSWSRLLNIRDEETEGHSDRVAEMTVRLAKHLGFNERETMNARWGALLHDIGKLGIPDNILLKPGPLTEEEWDIMRRHPVIADDMLSPISILSGALDIPRSHHERWDGTGYPQGLAGEEIPIAARLFAVVDVWDALRSRRPYREGWPADKVRQYLADHSGKHFDPRAVEAFLQIIDAEADPAVSEPGLDR